MSIKTKFQIQISLQLNQLHLLMDYQALAMFISKPIQEWKSNDIKKWLHFINMEKFIPNFTNQQCDGQILMNYNSKRLQKIGINSNVMQKKLLNWIQKGFTQFNDYLIKQADKENICPNLINRKTNKCQKRKTSKQIVQNQNIHTNIQPTQNIEIQEAQETYGAQMKITQFQGSKAIYYMAGRQGLKIGRSPSNQIQSLQISIEKEHANIQCRDNQFYLTDLGTKSGSFIKIHFKTVLKQGMLIEMGSYVLKVQKMSQPKQLSMLCLNTLTKQKQQLLIDLNLKPNYSFGRRKTNDFTRDDNHMSGHHAKIYFLRDQFVLEDMDSTNGTWLRLSDSEVRSIPYKLQDGTIFKIGNTINYICQSQALTPNRNRMEIQDNIHICKSCNTNERNIMFLPCKHTLNCQNCSQGVTACPLCDHMIEEKVKIYI